MSATIKRILQSKGIWLLFWILWMGVIFGFSHMAGSPSFYQPTAQVFIERKGAHIVEYAILFLLSAQVFSLFFPKESLRRIALVAFGWSFMYAALDELHQYFIPFRGAHIQDIGIDCIGISLAAVAVFLVFVCKRKKTR